MRLSIVTPWINHPELLPAYSAAMAQADEVIIIDNGSEPKTAAALQRYAGTRERVTVIRNTGNSYFAKANNQGLAVATGDAVLFVNNDVQGDPRWVEAARADLAAAGAGVLCGPSIQAQLLYGLRVPYLEGWCVGGSREALAAIGGWDEKAYVLPYWEDNDLCLRWLRQGPAYGLKACAWPLQHIGGQTAGNLIKWGAAFEQNRATFAGRVKAYWREQYEALEGVAPVEGKRGRAA